MERYNVGDWVICTSVTPENHEGLRVNGYYEVVGATLVDGNLVYTVTDCDGVPRFSIGDRFRKYTREDFFSDEWDFFKAPPEDKGNKYKVGDRVRLRDDLVFGSSYSMANGNEDAVVRGMEHLFGEVVTISKSDKKYTVNESEYFITDEMIEGYAEDTDEWDDILEYIETADLYDLVARTGGVSITAEPADTDEWDYVKAYSKDDEEALESLVLSLDDVFGVDMVNHPPHYNHGGIESIDVIRMCLTKKEFKGYLKGQVLKYRERAPYKGNQEQDYAKAKFYYDMLMEMEAKKQGEK